MAKSDASAVATALVEFGRRTVAVEINANPWRLDLDWRWHARALALGCRMSINPDAHATAELDLTHWGVEMARKGGVPKERVLNCLDLSALETFLASRKHSRRSPSAKVRRSTRPAERTPRGKTKHSGFLLTRE